MTASARTTNRAARRPVSVKRLLASMAYRREEFKNKVQEHLGGALLELYKARLAAKNGHSKWVQHWTTEARNLVERSFVAVLLHRVRGFKDKRQALDDVILDMRTDDESYRHAATSIVERDFGVTKLKSPLDDSDTVAFWAMVEAAAESVLGDWHATPVVVVGTGHARTRRCARVPTHGDSAPVMLPRSPLCSALCASVSLSATSTPSPK